MVWKSDETDTRGLLQDGGIMGMLSEMYEYVKWAEKRPYQIAIAKRRKTMNFVRETIKEEIITEGLAGYRAIYDYKSISTIRDFALSDARIRCISGPIASGKTSGCIMEIIRKSCQQAPDAKGIKKSRWLVVGSSRSVLLDTTIRSFFDWIPYRHFGEWKRSDLIYTVTKIPDVDIEILFRHPENRDNINNIEMLEITGAWINGGNNFEENVLSKIIQQLDCRIGRYPSIRNGGCVWSGIIMDSRFLTKKYDGDSFLYKSFKTEKRDGWKIFEQPSALSEKAENIINLSKDYYRLITSGKDQEFLSKYITGVE